MTASGPRQTAGSVIPFVVLCVLVVVIALVSVLLLNTSMVKGAYDAHDLSIEISDLEQRRAELLTEIDAQAAPQQLADRAAELGMVPVTTVGFVSLADGTVVTAGDAG